MFERRLPGRLAIVGLLEGVNRAGKRAARRTARVYTRSVHVHQAAESSSPASPTPLRSMRTFQSGKCAHGSMIDWARDGSSAPHAVTRLTFFRGAGNLPTHLWWRQV